MASKAKSIVFVDASIEAPLQLAAGIAFEAEILILSPDEDGVAQIAAALQSRPYVAEMSVVAHGAPGQLFLGSGELSLSTLSHHRDRLRQWTAQTALTQIHLYGCRVAAGDAGAEFLSTLHALTHANIAASTHLLGHADRGGDWTLDAFWGEVERRSLLTAEAIAAYPGILNDDIENAVELDTDATTAPPAQASADLAGTTRELNEPVHDPAFIGVSDSLILNQSTTSRWWKWQADVSGLVNVATTSPEIGTVLAVYSGSANATDADFGSLSAIDQVSKAQANVASSVTFTATSGVWYYFAVDGTGFQPTGTNSGNVTITLDTPPSITAGQQFTVPEYIGDGVIPTVTDVADGDSQVNAEPQTDVTSWAITGGNPDNDGDNNPAFAIDDDGNLTVNDEDDLDREGFPTNYELTVTATDDAGFTDTESIFIEVTNVNETPEVVTLNVPSSVNEGAPLTIAGQVFDPDGNIAEVDIDWGDGTTTTLPRTSLEAPDANGNRRFTATYAYADNVASGATIAVTATDQGSAGGTDPLTSDAVTRTVSILNLAPAIDIVTPIGLDPDNPVNLTISEDGSQSFQLSASDPAGDADPLTWSVSNPTAGGTVAGLNDPNALSQLLTYTPEEDFNGTDTFEIQVSDDDGGTDTVTVNVNVTPEPDAPENLSLSATSNDIAEGDTITLSGTFTDPDFGDSFTVTINWNDGTPNTVLSSAAGEVTFNAATNRYAFSAPHQFLANDDVNVVVTVTDSFNETTFATEAIAITNEPPTLSPSGKVLIIDEDTTGSFTFTATDPTAEGFTWSIDTANEPSQGDASLASTGPGATQTVTYTPNEDVFGRDNFVVQVNDGDGGITAANVAVFINPVNDAPIDLTVTPSLTTVAEGAAITLSGSFIDVDNSTDADLDDTHTITVNWGDGTVETFTENDSVDSNPIFTDTDQPTVGFGANNNLDHTYKDDGTYTVTVTITDAENASDSTTREIQVFNVAPIIVNADDATNPTPPDTTDSPLTVTEDTPLEFTVVAEDAGENDILTWTVFDAPDNGTLTEGTSPSNGVQNYTYTPDPDFNSTDTFTLLVSDGDGGFEELVYNVNVESVNDPPILLVGNFIITEDQEIPITPSLLGAIDDTTGAEGLTFTITGPGASSFLVDGDATDNDFTLKEIQDDRVSFLYKNALNLGVDGLSFSVKVSDGTESTQEFVQIPAENFTAVNDDPVFVDQIAATEGIQLGTFEVPENDSVLITTGIIAATDEETAEADLSFTVSQVKGGNFIVRNPSTGLFEQSNTFTQADLTNNRVRFQNNGSLTPPSYTITVSDGNGGSSTLTGSGTVSETNDAPEIFINNFSVVEDQTLTVTTLILNARDEDNTAGELTFTITGPDADSFSATSFTLQQVIDRAITFTFTNEENLTDAEGDPIGPEFTIEVTDPDGASDTEAGNVVSFTAKNDAPEITTDPIAFSLNEGAPFQLTTTDINATDEESAASNLTYLVPADLTNGTFLKSVNGLTQVTTSFTQAELENNQVFFVDDGTVEGPDGGSGQITFTLTVQDEQGLTDEAEVTITVNNLVDAAPTDLVNSFNITESTQFQVTESQLSVTDVDTPANQVYFEIAGDDAGSFRFSDDGGETTIADPDFTLQDIIDGNIYFLYEGEDTPEFTIKVDDETPVPATPAIEAAGNVVSFTPINDEPVLTINAPTTISDGVPLEIDPSVFVLTDAELDNTPALQTPADVVYTYTATNGFFADADGNRIESFTQADVIAGDAAAPGEAPVQFVVAPDIVFDGATAEASFTVTVNDNGFTLTDGRDFPTSAADTETVTLTVNATNDAPNVTVNNFNIIEGQPLTIDPSVLKIEDDETLNREALSIEIITASTEVQNAFSQTTFNYQDVFAGQVTFTWEGETAPPAFQIQVTDDGSDFIGDTPDTDNAQTTIVTANIASFINTNDAPTIEVNPIAVAEDGAVKINTTLINATDDDQQTGETITFNVNPLSLVGGTFRVGATAATATPSNTFTLTQILSGDVYFVNDGENTDNVPDGVTPNVISYEITATDGTDTSDPETGTGTIAPINDTPELTANAFSVKEGELLDVTTANLNVTDVDTPSDRIQFTIQGPDNQSFLINGNPSGETSTVFTLKQVIDNEIDFSYTGETTPDFTITVLDSGRQGDEGIAPVTLEPVAGNVTFEAVNDQPDLNITLPTATPYTIEEGGSFTIGTSVSTAPDQAAFILNDPELAVGVQTADEIVYTYTALNGFFADTNGDRIESFTQADVEAGSVQFIQNGNEAAPSFTVTVNDNGSPIPETDTVEVPASAFDFSLTNDAPTITLNSFDLKEGEPLFIDTSVLRVQDDETLNGANLTIQFVDAEGNELTTPPEAFTFSATTFTYEDVVFGDVVSVTYTGETAPPENPFFIQVTDDGRPSATEPADGDNAQSTLEAANIVAFEATNDDPVFETLASFEVNEDGFTQINNTLLQASDAEASLGLTAPLLTFNVTNVIGGNFTKGGTDVEGETNDIVTEFTQAEVDSGIIYFVNQGENTDSIPADSPVPPDAISFDIKVTDTAGGFTETTGSGTINPRNDAPELNTLVNNFVVTEGTKVQVTTTQLDITDVDSAAGDIKFAIAATSPADFAEGDGFIDADGNPLTITDADDNTVNGFTLEQLENNQVFFLYTGETPPAFDITLIDNNTTVLSPDPIVLEPVAASVTFNPVNDAPTLAIADALSIDEGGAIFIDTSVLTLTDAELAAGVQDASSLTYTYSATNGFFADADGNALPTNGFFTQADVIAGDVIQFVHDGSALEPSFTLTLNDNGAPTPETVTQSSGSIELSLVNDPPTLTRNALTITEGGTVEFSRTDNINATDPESPAFELTFKISAVENGFFSVVGDDGVTVTKFGDTTLEGVDTAEGSFELADVVADQVTFTHNGTEDAPTYSVIVEDVAIPGDPNVNTDVDGNPNTVDEPAPADITFIRVNNAPILQQTVGADAGNDLVPLTVPEGGEVPVTLANIDAIDQAGETPQNLLTFTVSDVQGGDFVNSDPAGDGSQAPAVVTEFTRADVAAGNITFVQNPESNVPPTYTLTVTDIDELGAESTTSETPFVGELVAKNDAPEQVTLGTIALTEGEAVTIDSTILQYTDEESAAANLTYSVETTTGGDFYLATDTDLTTPLTEFSQAEVNNEQVVFVDDGDDDTAPTFTLKLQDEELTSDPGVINEVTLTDANFQVADNFTAVNDLPTLADGTPIVDDEFITSFTQVLENTPIAIVSGTPGTNEAKLSVIDEESAAAELKYTVVSVTNGIFTVDDAEAQSFTQADVDNGLVEFVPQGEAAPTFELQLQDNNGGEEANTLTQTVMPDFDLVNQAPTITVNTLSPIEGGRIPFTTANLFATDRESPAGNLTFQIVNVSGGTFFINNTTPLDTDASDGTVDTFTVLELGGALSFQDDDDDAQLPPSYEVIVSDGEAATAPTAANIDLTNFQVNDPPTIVEAFFPITEGQLVRLAIEDDGNDATTEAILRTTDVDVDADPDDALNASTLTYTVSGPIGGAVQGGNFVELSLDAEGNFLGFNPVTTFTQQDVIDNIIAFQAADVDTAPSFKITVNDGAGGTDSVTIVDDPADPDDGIVFEPVDDPPVTVDDNFTTDQNTSLISLNVTANDSDDGNPPVLDVIQIADTDTAANDSVSLDSGATVTLNPNNTLNYDPGDNFKFLAAGEQDTDTFTYTVSDGNATNDEFGPDLTATVTITIDGLNDAPIAVADSGSVFENATLNLLVLNNDSDFDAGDTFSIASLNTTGTVGAVTTDGTSIQYDPRGFFNLEATKTVTDTFKYTIKDQNGALSQEATVTVSVRGVNDAPIGVNDVVNVLDNVTTDNINLTANDLDEDPNTELRITRLNGAIVDPDDLAGTGTLNLAIGTVTWTSISTVEFVPADSLKSLSVGDSQQATFTYTVSDGDGGASQANVTLVVNGANEEPVANDDNGFSTIEGTRISLDVLGNDTDLDANDTLLITKVNPTSLGGTVLNNGDDLTYIPPTTLSSGVTDTDTFDYFISDGNGGMSMASVTVTVTGFDGPQLQAI